MNLFDVDVRRRELPRIRSPIAGEGPRSGRGTPVGALGLTTVTIAVPAIFEPLSEVVRRLSHTGGVHRSERQEHCTWLACEGDRAPCSSLFTGAIGHMRDGAALLATSPGLIVGRRFRPWRVGLRFAVRRNRPHRIARVPVAVFPLLSSP